MKHLSTQQAETVMRLADRMEQHPEAAADVMDASLRARAQKLVDQRHAHADPFEGL